MRVLLTNHFPFHGSGTGTYTLDLAQGLRAAGHEVECLIVDRQRQGDEPFPVERIVCREGDAAADLPFDFPCFTSHPQSRNTFARLSDAQIAQYREAIRRRLDCIVARFDPHIIHGQHIWLMGQLALESGVPYVLTAQGTDLMGYRELPRCRRFAEQAAENAGRIIAASRFIERDVLNTFDIPPERVETVYSAIDPQPYLGEPLARDTAMRQLGLPTDCRRIVAYAGKLAPFKGVDTLLNAAAIYELDPLEITTVIAGDGAMRGELEMQARALCLARTFFLGDLDRGRCAALYGLADLVVVPSRGEPFGLVALEALASATPVIGTQAGGLAEILNDEVGALVPPDDHELLAMKIVEALDQDWKRTKGPAAREYVLARHSLAGWIERVTSIYRDVLDKRFGGRDWERR
jgi:glycosyltransferase involved in cell wall biosynthesis